MDLKFTSAVFDPAYIYDQRPQNNLFAAYVNDGRLRNKLRKISHPVQEVRRSYFNLILIAPHRISLSFVKLEWKFLAAFVHWLSENKLDKKKSMLRGAMITLILDDVRYVDKG